MRVAYKDLPDSEKLEIRESERQKFVRRSMQLVKRKPNPHRRFCEEYRRLLDVLQVGSDRFTSRPAHQCTVIWFERSYPRLAQVLEQKACSEVAAAICSNACGPRHMTDAEIMGQQQFECTVHHMRFSGDAYLYRTPDSFDDAVKIYEQEAAQ
jgi:hypothetical protein